MSDPHPQHYDSDSAQGCLTKQLYSSSDTVGTPQLICLSGLLVKSGLVAVSPSQHLDFLTLACYSPLPTFNGSTGLLPSSSLSYNASLFPQDNSSCLTIPTPVLSPVSCFLPIISSECHEPENAIFGLYLEDDKFSYELVGAMFDASVSEISCPASCSVSLGAGQQAISCSTGVNGMGKAQPMEKVQAMDEDMTSSISGARCSIFWDCSDVHIPLMSWAMGN